MVDGDGPVGQRGRGLGSITQGAGGVDPPAGMPRRVRVDVASQSPWCDARPTAAAAVSKTPGFGLYRGQLLGEGGRQDRALQLVEGPFGRVHGQQLVDLATQPVQGCVRICGCGGRLPPLTSNVSTRA